MVLSLTPQHRLSAATLLVIGVAVLTTQLALLAPQLGLLLRATESGGLVIEQIEETSPNIGNVSAGEHIVQLNGSTPHRQLLIEEPDQLGSWASYNALVAQLNQLDAAAKQGPIHAQIGQREVLLATRSRTLADLPPMFWFQIAVGSLGFLVAAGVYAFRPRDNGALHFALAGLGLLAFSSAAAVYSTRELIMAGDQLRLLSALNQFGAQLFTAALVALLWVYPKALGGRRLLPGAAYGAALVSAGGFVFQFIPHTGWSYTTVLMLFSTSFLFAFLQWRKTANSPLERAALKWYLLSIYLGTGLFAAAILIPGALGIAPPASQGLMFAVFLFMFVGIALGITRYRLFDLDRWWLASWSWFLGGVLVLGFDALLVSGIGLNHSTSLAISLALVGWAYFPARQWLFNRLRPTSGSRNRQVSRLVQNLFSAEDLDQLAALWRQHLASEWDVLEVRREPGHLLGVHILNNGQSLAVADVIEDQHLLLSYPFGGSRLFTRTDQMSADLLSQIAHQAKAGLAERLKAIEERRRIFGDLHDDVGSKLLSLLYRSSDPKSQELARSALEDLRDVVSQPDDGVQPLADLLADLRAEARDRLDEADIALNWTQCEFRPRPIPTFQARHLTRVLRECLNNAIKHASANCVAVDIGIDGEQLSLSVEDDGHGGDPDNWKVGRGILTIHHRLSKLGGSAAWQQTEGGGCLIDINLPLPEQPISSH